MRNELNKRNVGGYLHKSGCILDKIKADNEYFLLKLENFFGKYNSNYDGEVVIANDYFVWNNVNDHQEELYIDSGGGGGGINPHVYETAMNNDTKRDEYFVGKLSWSKHYSKPTLFFIPVYDIHKHVSNVVLRGYV